MGNTRLSWHALLAYGVPGLPLAAFGLPLVVYLPPYYSELPAIGTAAVGGMLFLARVFDVITDPLVGWASDKTRSRFGRRRPWMVLGAPVLLLGAWFLFMPPADAGAGYLLLWSMVGYLGWTLVNLPYYTWGAEISADYDERSRITASREGFLVLGTLVAILLPAVIERAGSEQAASLAALFWFLLATLPIALLMSCVGVGEPRFTRRFGGDWRQSFSLLARNAPFRRLLLANLLNGMANGLPATLFLFFVIHVIGAERWQAGVLLAVYFLSAVIGLPVWVWAGRNLSKHRVWCASMLWASAAFIWAPLLGEGDLWLFALLCVLSGVCLGVDQAYPASIQADVVDEDTAGGGDTRTGLYFGLWGMAIKLAFALAVGLSYPILEFAGFEAGGGNDEAALLTLALLYGLLPVAIKLGVVAMMWDFPLDRVRHAELRRKIAAQTAA